MLVLSHFSEETTKAVRQDLVQQEWAGEKVTMTQTQGRKPGRALTFPLVIAKALDLGDPSQKQTVFS